MQLKMVLHTRILKGNADGLIKELQEEMKKKIAQP